MTIRRIVWTLLAGLCASISLWGCADDDAEFSSPIGRAAKEAQGLSPEDVDERLAEARVALAGRDFEAAVDLLQPAVSRPQVDVEIYEAYGSALLEMKRASLAMWPLLRASEGIAPDSPLALLLARALLQGGDPDAALRRLDAWIEEAPDSAPLHRIRVQTHLRRLDNEAAVDDLDVVLDLQPDDLATREVLIAQLEELEEVEEARSEWLELYERSVSLGLGKALQARYCAGRANFEERHENPEGARAQFEACLELFPIDPEVVVGWSHFLAAQGEPERSLEVLQAALDEGGQLRQRLHIALGDRLVALGRREEAVATFEAAAEGLGSPQPLIELADYQMAWGDVESASRSVGAAIEMLAGRSLDDPDFDWKTLEPRLRFAFADILIRTEQLERVGAVVESLASDEGEAVYRTLLEARVALESREPGRALELFDESFKTWPSNVGARYLAGRAAMELGEFDRGLSLYQDAFRADTNESDAGLVLARLQLSQGLMLAAGQTISTYLGNVQGEPSGEALRLLANVATNIGAFDTAHTTREQLQAMPGWADRALADRAAEVLAREGAAAALRLLEEGGCLGEPVLPESLLLWYRIQKEQQEKEGEEQAGVAARAVILERAQASPADAPLALAEALVHRADEALEASVAAARRAAEADPSLLEAHDLLGASLLDLSRWEEAESAFREAIALDADDLSARMGLAEAAMGSGRRDEAERRYYKALVTHPWHGRAAQVLARIAYERGDRGDQTVIWARWGARFNEGLEVSDAAMLLGELRLERQEFDEALLAFGVAAETGAVEDPRLAVLTARALVGLDRRDEAIALLTGVRDGAGEASMEEVEEMLRGLDGRAGEGR